MELDDVNRFDSGVVLLTSFTQAALETLREVVGNVVGPQRRQVNGPACP